MANLKDIGVSAAINLLSAFAFLVVFAILRIQPVNDRVYFPKWYRKGVRSSPTHSGTFANKFVNLDLRTYLRFLNWMPDALKMPESELVDHAGLDSVAYLRIYLLGLKIFVPLAILAFVVLVPINWTGKTLEHATNVSFSDIDKLSISNIPAGSKRLYAHTIMSYVFTLWAFYVLRNEYKMIADMRLRFLASQNRRPDQFTVLVRNIPPDPDESVSEHVQHFFCVNHPDHYLTHQTGFWGLWGTRVDAIDYYTAEINKLTEEENAEREKVISDANSIIPAAFVSFKSRWGAAVCAQTQQSRNPTIWLTNWAPEPRDIFWDNLSIPYVELTIRRLVMAVSLFALIFFFMIPIAFVQSLANIEGIQKVLPFLKPLIDFGFVKSFIQGFLPGIALKIFLILLPLILMTMSKIEGFTSLSSLEKRSAGKYYLFILVNVFLGSIVTGTALQQLNTFLNEPPTEIPKTFGVSIPMKATFFITYTMVDGWAGIAAEIIRLVPLVIFHLKNTFLVKTDQDRDEAMDPGYLRFATNEPRIQFYILLGLVYAPVTPILLPFIIVFFAFSYVVFRHQVINVYDQIYESGAAFWPDVHRRIIINLIISQLLLMGLLSTRKADKSTPLLILLPVITIWFHVYCKGRFEPAFVTFPLQEAMVKDTLERATEPNLNLRTYLQDAYVHPVFKGIQEQNPPAVEEEEDSSPLVATKRRNWNASKNESDASSKAGSGTGQ
ncbi:CSC1-like protein [Citrus sinensis]|uniref:CSC1-like protein n=1 Tax=Citrus sinensis TaxID=2711 RepID=A0ACB8MK85_CITSI|nr:CSC1-like protein [Citrus sinensis]